MSYISAINFNTADNVKIILIERRFIISITTKYNSWTGVHADKHEFDVIIVS